jgi:hypothetical protein
MIVDNDDNSTNSNFNIKRNGDGGESLFSVLETGFVGIGEPAPAGDLFVEQSDASATGTGGIFVNFNSDNWKMFHSGLHLSFANEGTRYAYVEDNTGNYVITSDKNLKTSIRSVPSVLAGVKRLNPVTYSYKSSSDPNVRTYGFLAQEVAEVFPEVTRYAEDGTPGLAYDLFSILSIKAIQEQQEIIEAQQRQIDQLIEAIEQLQHK